MAYDLLIKNGTIVDGTRMPAYRGDIGIRNGRIVAMGNLTESASKTIDATGLVVAPGFIDIHTHYDAQVFWDPRLRPSSSQGVTTVVAGNCGFTIAPTRSEHRDTIVHTLENVEDMDPATLTEGVVRVNQIVYDTGGWNCGGYYARDIAAGGLGATTFVPALAASSDG